MRRDGGIVGAARLSATTYDVELVFSSSTVSESKLSAAVNSLKANGVEVVKSESAVDPIAELETIPGSGLGEADDVQDGRDCGSGGGGCARGVVLIHAADVTASAATNTAAAD